jgi:Family of unknown function (DUF6161)
MTEEIKLDLPGCNIPRYKYSFIPADIEALCRWCESQSLFFRNTSEVIHIHNTEPALGTVRNAVQQISNLSSHAAALRQSLIDNRASDAAQHVTHIRNTISTFIESLELPPADSIIGVELNRITAAQPDLLLPALFAIHRPRDRSTSQINGSFPEFWRGVHLGCTLSLLEHGQGIDSEPAIKTIEGKVSEWQSAVTGLRHQAAEAISTLGKTRGLGVEKIAAFETAHAKRIDDTSKTAGKLISDAETEISKFKDFVKSEIALKAPVTYWEDKGRRHENIAVPFGAIAVLLMGFGVWVLFVFSGTIGRELIGNKDLPQYSGMAIFIAIVTLSFWILRLCVRVFFSQMHLAIDAKERVAMVKTYMSLHESGLAPKDGDLSPVLVALFRPTSDGMVKDEAMPPILAEALTRSSRPN